MSQVGISAIDLYIGNPELKNYEIAAQVGCSPQWVSYVIKGYRNCGQYKPRHFTGSIQVVCGISRCYGVAGKRIETHIGLTHKFYLLNVHEFRKACVAVSLCRATPQQWKIFEEAVELHQKLKNAV